MLIEKTVRDIQKVIEDSFSAGLNWSTLQIQIFHWSGSLTFIISMLQPSMSSTIIFFAMKVKEIPNV